MACIAKKNPQLQDTPEQQGSPTAKYRKRLLAITTSGRKKRRRLKPARTVGSKWARVQMYRRSTLKLLRHFEALAEIDILSNQMQPQLITAHAVL